MNEEQARAVDIGIRAISGATHHTTRQCETDILLDARRTLEGMLSEGFAPCQCGRRPRPWASLDDSEGFAFVCWYAVCPCCRQVRAESLEGLKDAWNKEAET